MRYARRKRESEREDEEMKCIGRTKPRREGKEDSQEKTKEKERQRRRR